MKANQAIVETLAMWKVDALFGCPGTTEAPLLDALVDRDSPRFFLTTHESVAVAMADGYARMAGKPGVAVLHTNVGLANGIGQIHNACVNGVPLVIIAGIKHTQLQSRGGVTTAHDIREMVRQYTKWDWSVLRPDAIPEDLTRALRLAMAPPRKPTFLAIPEDLMAEEIEADIPEPQFHTIPARVRPPQDLVSKAVEIIFAAERPVIFAGSEVGKDQAFAEVGQLSEAIWAPVFCEKYNLDVSTFPTGHPCFIGQFAPRHPLIQKADVFLALGAKFPQTVPPPFPAVPPGAKLIHMHIDPREIGMIYPVTVPLIGDTKSGVNEILTGLREMGKTSARALESRRREIVRAKAEAQELLARHYEEAKATKPIHRVFLGAVLGRIMDEETVVVSEGLTSSGPVIDYVPRFHPYSFYSSGAGGCLGWGMGAPLGVKIAAPEKKVIAFIGDGVFQFGMQALFTAAKHHIPVTFVVANNGMYAAVKCGLYRYGGQAAFKRVFPACDISGPDYAAIARGFGIEGMTVSDPDRLEETLRKAIQRDGPVVVDVLLDPNDVGPIER